jgi:hypothetical protein
VAWQSWVDKQIYDAQQRGDFDNLSGKGKPIADLDEPLDPLWWVKRKLRDEGVSFLPPSLAIRREVELVREQIAAATTEQRVRELVTHVNARIREVNRNTISGPPTTVMPMNVEAVVVRWRETQAEREPET